MSILDRVEQELRRQYFSQGKYGVEKSMVESLGGNRVAVGITIKEGRAAKIKTINVVGNKAYDDDDLVKQFELTTPTLISFFTKSDQYSNRSRRGPREPALVLPRPGLHQFQHRFDAGRHHPGQERGLYHHQRDRGRPLSSRGGQAGGRSDHPGRQSVPLVATKRGDIFSRKAVTQTSTNLSDRLGDEGYAFANVNPVPEIDNAGKTVALTISSTPASAPMSAASTSPATPRPATKC